MSESGSPPLKCNVCGETKGLKRCGFCKVRFYCSREHQMKDWPSHKTFCENNRGVLVETCKPSTNVNNNALQALVSTESKNNEHPENGKETLQKKDKEEPALPGEQRRETTEGSEKTGGLHDEKNDSSETKKRRGKGVPFDTRPYLPVKTISMPISSCYRAIAKVAVEHLNLNGYCVIDGLFTEREINRALRDMNKCNESGQFKRGQLAGGRASDQDEKKVINADIRSDKIIWAEGTEDSTPGIRDVMTKLDHIVVEFNELFGGKYEIINRTKAMMACYPGTGAYYRRHVDNPNKDGRVVTCILYLNKDWNVEKDGGKLRILPSGGDSYVDVAPTANRLLFFWSNRRNPHEVHPAYRTRYAVTVWYMDKAEREHAKLDQLQEELQKIRGTQQLLSLQKYIQRQKEITEKIDETTNKAIASLTEEELEAIGEMIEGAPNPREILTSLGIYHELQDKLLERLKQIKVTTGK